MSEVFEFHVPKDRVGIFNRSGGVGRRFVLMPNLLDFPFGELPDSVNPRSHGKKCLKTGVAKAIRATLENDAPHFSDRNRGLTVLADESATAYDARREKMAVALTRTGGVKPLHGLVDGGTTNAVAMLFQQEMLETEEGKALLRSGLVNIEILTGVTNLAEVADISEARNTSVQVKLVSLADLRGAFDWLKKHLSTKYPAAVDGNPGIIAYDENAQGLVNILDVLCILHLFHPAYCAGDEQPKESYTAKKEMTRKLEDGNIQSGFRSLLPVVFDILDMHDYVWATFGDMYGGRLGARKGQGGKHCFEKYSSQRKLYFSDHLASYRMPRGVLFPVLSSMRCLLKFNKSGASWTTEPHAFWDKYGSRIITSFFEQFKEPFCGSDANKYGKSVTSYSHLYSIAERLASGRTVRSAS